MALKIALLLSGLPRMWQPSIQTQLDMFRDYDTDVYFHFWDTIDAAEKNALLQLTRPKAHIFQAPVDFSHLDRDPTLKLDNVTVPSRMASQYYSWKQATSLFAADAGRYDFVMRSRSDLQFVRSLGGVIPEMQKRNLVVPWWEKDKSIADFFALGDPETILYYCSLFDRMMDYAKDVLFNPEFFLIHHLVNMPDRPPIRIEELQQWGFIRRPHMANYSIQQCFSEDPGVNKWLDPEVVDDHRAFHSRSADSSRLAYFERLYAERFAFMVGQKPTA
jgi:hypothetical protein